MVSTPFIATWKIDKDNMGKNESILYQNMSEKPAHISNVTVYDNVNKQNMLYVYVVKDNVEKLWSIGCAYREKLDDFLCGSVITIPPYGAFMLSHDTPVGISFDVCEEI